MIERTPEASRNDILMVITPPPLSIASPDPPQEAWELVTPDLELLPVLEHWRPYLNMTWPLNTPIFRFSDQILQGTNLS